MIVNRFSKFLFAIFLSCLCHIGFASDGCIRDVDVILGFKTPSFYKEIEIGGRNINYYQVELPKNKVEIPADEINWKAYHRDAFAEVFFKMIRPSIINEWKLQKFDLSEVVQANKSSLTLGLDVNHTYLILYDSITKTYTRADGGARSAFYVRRDIDTVTSGLFVHFDDLSPKEVETISNSFNRTTKYTTCTHAACSSLAEIGVYFGDEKEIPQSTAEALMAVLKGGLKQDEVPLKVEIFTTSNKPFQKQIEEAIRVSKINGSIRQKQIMGFVAVIYYGGKTVLKWVLLDLPRKILDQIIQVPMSTDSTVPKRLPSSKLQFQKTTP